MPGLSVYRHDASCVVCGLSCLYWLCMPWSLSLFLLCVRARVCVCVCFCGCCWQRRLSPSRKVLHFPSGRGHRRVGGVGIRTSVCLKTCKVLGICSTFILVTAVFFSFWSCRLYSAISGNGEMLGISNTSACSHWFGCAAR